MSVDEPTTGNDSLSDRLGPVIGEACSDIAASLDRLVRQAFRDGVEEMEDELHGLVSEVVDRAVTARMPDFVRATEETAADKAAEIAQQQLANVQAEGAAAVERLSTELADARQALSGTSQQLKQLEEKVLDGEQVAARVQDGTTHLAGKLNELSEGFEPLGKSIDSLGNDILSLGTRLDEESQLREQDAQQAASNLEVQAASYREQLDALTAKIGELDTRLAESQAQKRGWFRRKS